MPTITLNRSEFPQESESHKNSKPAGTFIPSITSGHAAIQSGGLSKEEQMQINETAQNSLSPEEIKTFNWVINYLIQHLHYLFVETLHKELDAAENKGKINRISRNEITCNIQEFIQKSLNELIFSNKKDYNVLQVQIYEALEKLKQMIWNSMWHHNSPEVRAIFSMISSSLSQSVSATIYAGNIYREFSSPILAKNLAYTNLNALIENNYVPKKQRIESELMSGLRNALIEQCLGEEIIHNLANYDEKTPLEEVLRYQKQLAEGLSIMIISLCDRKKDNEIPSEFGKNLTNYLQRASRQSYELKHMNEVNLETTATVNFYTSLASAIYVTANDHLGKNRDLVNQYISTKN